MRFPWKSRVFISLGCAVLIAIPFLLLSIQSDTHSIVTTEELTLNDLLESTDPFDAIVRDITINGIAQHFKHLDIPGVMCICLHPDTDPALVDEILRNLPTFVGVDEATKMSYYLSGPRWSITATDGATGVQGDPINLTWGFVPDGTTVDGAPSTLHADFTAAWGGSTAWMTKIRNAMTKWEAVIGIDYVEVDDDGANWPNFSGVLGVRPDVRIAGRSIDGPGNVLAYNYYPNVGDMLLDCDDTNYYLVPTGNYAALKNVVAHEHGHGIGLGHSTPENCTKLMEAYACGAAFLGPQDDDIRGGMRYYGDIYENNDVLGDATDLGTIVDTVVTENLSINVGSDLDWYLVDFANGTITIEVDPIGSTYDIGYQGGPAPTPTSTDSISDPDFCLFDQTGTVLLDSVYSGGMGETEILAGFSLPYAGDYYIKVFRKGGTGNNVQRYTMTIMHGVTVDIAMGEDVPTRNSLDAVVFPNPFNPTTSVRFFAPAAGPYTIDIYNVSGRLTRSIEGNSSNAGMIDVPWNGLDNNGASAASGIYLMRVNAGGLTETARAILVR